MLEIYDFIKELPTQDLPIVQLVKQYDDKTNAKILTTVDCQALGEVGSFIKDIVDFEGSSLEARFIVKRGVDAEVAHIFHYSS